ncbi:MAG: response regulator [Anaerolineae bacterium]|nr:response regulator [Anaerolineae bacterium]
MSQTDPTPQTAPTATPDSSPDRSRTQQVLLAHIRHELRTPINAIMGYSEMLLEDVATLAAEDATTSVADIFTPDLERIHSAAVQLLALVNAILDPAKIEAAREIDLEEFGAQLRHELRTPINTIIGYCEMLLEDESASTGTAFTPDLERIHAAAQRFLALINDVVSFSISAPGEVTSHLEVVDTSAMIQEVVTTMRTLDTHEETGADKSGLLLVVDDNAINRDVLSRRLEREGHRVMVAEHGRRALEMMAAQSFDLVLLDIMMPEMNGYQVLQHLKADSRMRDIPVIMISALDDIDSVVRCIEMGAEDYLPKPFNPVLLRGRVGASLEKKRLRDQEVEYLQNVAHVTDAAGAVEQGTFDPDSLAAVATRRDALGQLARVFQRMAREVYAREQRLRQQVQELRIEIDEVKKTQMVSEITKTDSFRALRERAQRLRRTQDEAKE